MFVCDTCHFKGTGKVMDACHFPGSYGPCELCRRTASCADCHCTFSAQAAEEEED